jgi:hypothetical protein
MVGVSVVVGRAKWKHRGNLKKIDLDLSVTELSVVTRENRF